MNYGQICIIGAPFSGSTLLGFMLGEHPDCENVKRENEFTDEIREHVFKTPGVAETMERLGRI